jgi:hypothetical protein
MMGAGNAGASSYIALNGNNGGGSKKQGLATSVGRQQNNNGRSYGNNRDVVFYMNQLGGVGKNRSMFSTNAGGVRIPIKPPEPEPEIEGETEPEPEPEPTWSERYTTILTDNIEACNYACGNEVDLFIYPKEPNALTDKNEINTPSSNAISLDITTNSNFDIESPEDTENYILVNNGYYVGVGDDDDGYTFNNNVDSTYTHFLVETNIVSFSSDIENAIIGISACNKQMIDISSSDSGIKTSGNYFYRIHRYNNENNDNLYYNGIQQQTYETITQGSNGGDAPFDQENAIVISGLNETETLYGTVTDGVELTPDFPNFIYFYNSTTDSFDIDSNITQCYSQNGYIIIQYNEASLAAKAVTKLNNSCFYWSDTPDFSAVNYANVVNVNACKFIDSSNAPIPYRIFVNATSYAELNAIPIYVCEVDEGDYTTNTIIKSNSFIQGSSDVSPATYKPGTNPPDTTSVFDIDPQVMYKNTEGYADYLPSKFPCADYVTASEAGFVDADIDPIGIYPLYYDNLAQYMSKEPQQTADQCRWLWRMGNYIRNNLDVNSTNQNKISNIVLSSTYAFHYAYNQNNNSLALNTRVYSLTLDDDSNSADVTPSYFTSATALKYSSNPNFSYTTFQRMKSVDQIAESYADVTNSIGITKDVLKSSSDMTGALINEMVSNTAGIWPYFDGVTGGGQQLGLAGCGMGCTIPFLASADFNAMALYDGSTYNPPTEETLTKPQIQAICDAYYILYLRGQKCNPYNNIISSLSTETDTWADLLGKNAYLTNIRIRNVNISEENELSFGFVDDAKQPLLPENVPSWVSTTNKKTGSVYQPCYFPIHAIPDQGWGAVTMEIFTYQGIAAVIRNDYKGFCRWHRMYYYLLFVQNGGYMTNWKNNPASDSDSYETIDPSTCDYGKDPSGDGYSDQSNPNGFLPSYLERGKAGSDTWVSDGKDDDLKNYSVFTGDHQWPRDWDNNNPKNTTNYWANRIYPYRGGPNYGAAGTSDGYAISWTTPCYTVGYSPVWVACGLKNKNTNSDPYGDNYPSAGDIDTAEPIWEAANPYFSCDAGLYTATDADMNAFIAYTLASLKWTTMPEIGTENPSFTGDNYDCDVADFEDVKKASEEFDDSGDTFNFSDRDADVSIRVDQKIGYGINLSTTQMNTDKVSSESSDDMTRHTTWKYMRTAIARCLVSTNGLAADGDYGNFTNHMPAKSLVTLGRDTNSSALKIDYIDPTAIAMARETPPGFDVW